MKKLRVGAVVKVPNRKKRMVVSSLFDIPGQASDSKKYCFLRDLKGNFSEVVYVRPSFVVGYIKKNQEHKFDLGYFDNTLFEFLRKHGACWTQAFLYSCLRPSVAMKKGLENGRDDYAWVVAGAFPVFRRSVRMVVR